MFSRRFQEAWCKAKSDSTGSGECSGEGLGGFGAEPGQVQQGSGEGSGEGLEVFGAEPGQVQQGSGKVPEEVWEALARSQVKRFRRRFRQALMQRQVRFNRVPERFRGEGLGGFGAEPGWVQQGSEKVPEKVPRRRSGGFGAERGQVRQGSGEGSGEGLGNLWCRARSGSTGSGEGSGEGFTEGSGEVWLFFFLFSCMCTRHTWMSLEHNCALLSLS